jgi:hypothetical protein
MNFFRKPHSIYQVLGVGLALLLPALAVGLEIPNSFTAGTPIRAADVNENFEAVAEELAALRAEVEALKEQAAIGPRVALTTLSAENNGAIFLAKSAGVVTITSGGSGFGNVAVDARNGLAIASDNWTLTCGGTSGCPVIARAREGNSTDMLVAAGEYFLIALNAAETTATSRVTWQPIHGADAANGQPELIREGIRPVVEE